MTAPTTEKPYGVCKDCGIDLADRDAVSAHCHDTMAPTGEPGIVERGHSVSIVNPTEAERRASRVRLAIADAVDAAYEDIYDRVERGEFTAAEVKDNLWHFDLGDGWDDYVEEAEA